MAKKLKAVVRLQIEAGKANPAPPIGPALAPHGINLMAFCKDYNGRTSSKAGEIIPQDPQALASLFAKIAAVMGKLERLPKSGYNNHFKYNFVTDGDVSDAVRAALADEGVAFFASMRAVEIDGAKVRVLFTYTFADSQTGATWSCDWQGEANDITVVKWKTR